MENFWETSKLLIAYCFMKLYCFDWKLPNSIVADEKFSEFENIFNFEGNISLVWWKIRLQKFYDSILKNFIEIYEFSANILSPSFKPFLKKTLT